MNTQIFDDMLFEDLRTHDQSEQALDDLSDDDLLFAQLDEDPLLWDAQEDAMLLSATTIDDVAAQISFDDTDISSRMHRGKSVTERPARNRYWVIARIEAMLENIVDALIEGRESLTIKLKSRAALSRRVVKPADGVGQAPEPKARDISFPGATAQEACNFTVLLRILEIVHGGLVDNTVMTKRDIYYRHPDLFVKQTVVDRYVDDLACTFCITRSQLNITAAAKGLVAGNFRLVREQGHHADGMNDQEGMLVPTIGDNDFVDLKSVRWILVIEKEATFRSLLSSSHWATLRSCGVVLTAKGYPDIASRKFLRQLANDGPHIPMYAFMDLDPDGIAILSTYKYSSYRLAHEDAAPNETPALSLPHIRWLGVQSHHISRTPVDESDTGTGTMPHLQGLMRLSHRDRSKAISMLQWDLCAEGGPEQVWRHELQTMLALNIKAEMQILDELHGGLLSWLADRLDQASEPVSAHPVASTCSDNGMLF